MSTSPQAAIKAAKQLVGCYPHARPPDPEVYAGALASVLAQYPLGLVQECVDPRTGLARAREFPPTIACVVTWCDARLEYHQMVASYVGPPPMRPQIAAGPISAAEINAVVQGVKPGRNLEELLEQRAAMRRESVDRILRYADRIAPREETP